MGGVTKVDEVEDEVQHNIHGRHAGEDRPSSALSTIRCVVSLEMGRV